MFTGRWMLLLLAWLILLNGLKAQEKTSLQAAEQKRIAAIDKVRPAVVAVFGPGGGGGGSGVVIHPDGYCLTNFHVTQPCGNFLYGGLADGTLYDAVIVSIDPVGDVAMIKLIPKEPGKPFPFAPMGNSDKVQIGDWSIAMGNPFLLATDFTPTVTFGIISGTHRYQGPAGIILEYTDCLQTEASINPGNSGGPLFNLDGEVIGINGRGSFEKRGRVNSGAGYAISINQIKNFMGHLRGGLNVDHATLGALVKTEDDGRTRVTKVLETTDAYRRGLREDDELIAFAGRSIGSVNQFKNVLGIYPKGWRLPMTYVHQSVEKDATSIRREILVRLAGVQAREIVGEGKRRDREQPARPPAAQAPSTHAGRKLYKKKEGFTNYYFNELERDRVLAAFAKTGKFDALTGTWSFQGEVERPLKSEVLLTIDDKQVSVKIDNKESIIEPLKAGESPENLASPAGSGGLAMTLYHWRRFLIQGKTGFDAAFFYAGTEPYYPLGEPANYTLADVIQTEYAATVCKWYFNPADGMLLGCECWLLPDTDPCELTFLDYAKTGDNLLPTRLLIRHADREFGLYKLTKASLTPGPAREEKK
ncbi:MAG: trypsin-like peptidase domain-containing protein [Planctomycetia bacterium]|nr:trypsin-like peptidase domain-containing protein [Planctomycetia bacterium]